MPLTILQRKTKFWNVMLLLCFPIKGEMIRNTIMSAYPQLLKAKQIKMFWIVYTNINLPILVSHQGKGTDAGGKKSLSNLKNCHGLPVGKVEFDKCWQEDAKLFELHFQKNTCYLVFEKATGRFLVVSDLAKCPLYIYFNIY